MNVLDLARDIFRNVAAKGHLLSSQEAARLANHFALIHHEQIYPIRKNDQLVFDTVILERAGDYYGIRVKGAPDFLEIWHLNSIVNGVVLFDGYDPPTDDDPMDEA